MKKEETYSLSPNEGIKCILVLPEPGWSRQGGKALLCWAAGESPLELEGHVLV